MPLQTCNNIAFYNLHYRYQRRHHCRSCGQAVCDKCSLRRRPVPERDWYEPKRVCDACYNRKSE